MHHLDKSTFSRLGNSVVKRGSWLVGCFGFNSPLRQYFSLYRAVSQREGERIDESKKTKSPHPKRGSLSCVQGIY